MSDKLLKGLDALTNRAKSSAYETKKTFDQSSIGRFQRDWTALSIFWYQFLNGSKWVYWTLIHPIIKLYFKPIRWLFSQYQRLWKHVTMVPDQYGTLEFSKVRGGLMVLVTVGSLFLIPPTVEFVYDASMYGLTGHRNETMYLFDSQEIIPVQNIHAVKGCKVVPCNDTDTIYFRVEPKLFNHIWSLIVKGELFFPDYVAVVAPGVNKCTVTTYGIRIKLVMRSSDWYPEMLDLTCEKVNN